MDHTETYQRGSLVVKNTWHPSGKKAGEMLQSSITIDPEQKITREEKWIFWDDTGRKRSQGVLIEGKKHGRWIFWKPNGSIDTDVTGDYRDDERIVTLSSPLIEPTPPRC